MDPERAVLEAESRVAAGQRFEAAGVKRSPCVGEGVRRGGGMSVDDMGRERDLGGVGGEYDRAGGAGAAEQGAGNQQRQQRKQHGGSCHPRNHDVQPDVPSTATMAATETIAGQSYACTTSQGKRGAAA